jgi:hypothetical protein
MAEAEPVIRAVPAGANVPTSIRSTDGPRRTRVRLGSGLDPRHLARRECRRDRLRHRHECQRRRHGRCEVPRPVADPGAVQGLEFDLVALIGPETFGEGIDGVGDRNVAMTRATQRLVILMSS